MSTVEFIQQEVLNCISDCVRNLHMQSPDVDLVITRLESAVSAVEIVSLDTEIWWSNQIIHGLQLVILALEGRNPASEGGTQQQGRPKIDIDIGHLEYYLSLNFKVSQISRMIGISKSTIFRRLNEHGISVSQTYSSISDEELETVIHQILLQMPNTGYKRLKGYLMQRGLKIIDRRVRETMRIVDPVGVYQRTVERNKIIRRRQYYVKYSNQLWHLDGNLKLIRWNIVIRCGIDGKSRTIVYVQAGNNNRADTHLNEFMQGVREYGVPFRTRSDKGGENVLIAKFMIENRGTGRGSHICGRSVHNQRIERLWRDIRYGCTSSYYQLFVTLEENGILCVDNPKHLYLLHRIFLPRLNNHLTSFMQGWNYHPISSEGNYSPRQLMLLNLPPPSYDLTLPPDQVEDFAFSDVACHSTNDLGQFEDSIVFPIINVTLSDDEQTRLSEIDLDKSSEYYGYDVYCDAVALLD